MDLAAVAMALVAVGMALVAVAIALVAVGGDLRAWVGNRGVVVVDLGAGGSESRAIGFVRRRRVLTTPPLNRKALSFALLAGGIAAGVAFVTAPACTNHQCDPTDVAIGADAGGTGAWISFCAPDASSNCEIDWASTDTMNSSWTDFPGNAQLTFVYPPLPPLPPGFAPDFADFTFGASVSAVQPLEDANGNFNVTQASGQLAEFRGWSSSSITVLNASCQDYSVLVQIRVPVLAPDGGASSATGALDAGADPDGDAAAPAVDSSAE